MHLLDTVHAPDSRAHGHCCTRAGMVTSFWHCALVEKSYNGQLCGIYACFLQSLLVEFSRSPFELTLACVWILAYANLLNEDGNAQITRLSALACVSAGRLVSSGIFMDWLSQCCMRIHPPDNLRPVHPPQLHRQATHECQMAADEYSSFDQVGIPIQ